MKIKKTSLAGLISACFMVSVLIVGAFAVSATDNTPDTPPRRLLSQNEDSVSHNEGDLDFSLNDASTLDGINVIVNPNYWGSRIFDESGNVREGLGVTWDFREISEETYNEATQELQHIPLPTYSDEQWAQIISDIESGVLKPFDFSSLPEGAEVTFFDGENVIYLQ